MIREAYRTPDYVNFDKKFSEQNKFEKFNGGFAVRKDERTGILTAKEQNCNDYILIKNYIKLLGDTSKYHSIYYNNNKFKCYSFLDFGAIPIIMLPLNILNNEQSLHADMLRFASEELRLKRIYKLPIIDLFSGAWKISLNKTDVWTTREDLGEALGKQPYEVHTIDFFECYMDFLSKGEENAN